MNDLLNEIEKLEKNPSIIKVFGAIIYSDSHPHIKKVLKDEYYWKALDDISGTRWVIFSARAVEGHYRIEGGSVPGTFGMMVQVWKEPNLNKQLVEYLGISSTEDPYFVIFTRLKSGVILRSILKINDSTLEKAYKRIRSIIKNITYAIEKIDKENIENYESVFNAIDMSVFNIKNFDSLKKLFDFYELFKKIRP
jgi:hypothetical protein